MAHLLPLLARLTAQLFVSGLWQGLLLLAAVALALRLLPVGSAALRAALWTLTFALAVAVPFLHLGAPSPVAAAPRAALHLGPSAELSIAAAWLTLSLVRALQLAMEGLRLRRLARAATPLAPSPDLLDLLEVGRRRVTLCASTAVDSPSVLGFFHPRLLLPERLLPSLSPADLRQILLHEREHLIRHDDWINLLQRLGLVLFPLNPALLVIDRRLGAERELACDAAVVARTAEPLSYAHCLTRLAEQRLRLRSLALSLAAWSRRSELTRRIESLLLPAHGLSPARARATTLALVLLLTGGAAEMSRAPQLISFDNSSSAATPTASASLRVSGSPVAARAIPASYSPDRPARAVLLRATVPTPHREPISLHRRPAARAAGLEQAPAALPSQPRSVLTAAVTQSAVTQSAAAQSAAVLPATAHLAVAHLHARQSTPAAARRVVLLSNDLSTYAAVPFADGWLVFQL